MWRPLEGKSIWTRVAAWSGLPIATCFVLALGCRVIRRSPELLSSDAADLAADIAALLCDDGPWFDGIGDLILYRLGGVQPLVVLVHGLAGRYLDISIAPTTWEWTTIIVSSASAPLAFIAGRRFGGAGAGWAWGAFLAVSPIHVMLGRNLGAPWAYEICFQLALLSLTDRHLSRATAARGNPAILCTSISAYIWCGNQMLAIFPVLTFAVLAHVLEQPRGERFAFLHTKLVSVWLLLPFASAVSLAYCTFVLSKGHLYHALFEKQKALGWYWKNFYADLVHNVGYVPAWLCLVALVCAVSAPFKLWDRRRIPLIYALCYALPFVFLVNRGTTLTRGYSIYGVTGLLGLVALMPGHIAAICARFGVTTTPGPLGWSRFLNVIQLIFLAVGTGSSAYRAYSIPDVLGVKGFQGKFGRAIGAAASAAVVQRLHQTKPKGRGVVFSDAYGGTGLEPPIMRLYFKRPFFAHYDAPRLAPYAAFAPKAALVDFAVIRPENSELVSTHFPDLSLAATVFTNTTDETILLVYARGYDGSPMRISAEDGVESYSVAFPHFCAD